VRKATYLIHLTHVQLLPQTAQAHSVRMNKVHPEG